MGDFAREVSANAGDLNAACVVLAPSTLEWTPAMTTLTRTCRQPVFITQRESPPLASMLAYAASNQKR
jgi:hypothetical protein